MEMEIRAATVRQITTNSEDEDEFVVEGVAAPFDSRTSIGNWFTEEFRKGAFRDIGDDVVMLANHDGLPLARVGSKTMSLREESGGLTFSATLDRRDTQANNIFVQLERGDLSGVSAGFIVREDIWESKEKGPDHRIITKADLMEISLTPMPAYRDTDVQIARERRNIYLQNSKKVLINTYWDNPNDEVSLV